jgi:hypothetical protein
MVRKYAGDDMPEVSESSSFDDLELDAQAVVDTITEELNRAVAD